LDNTKKYLTFILKVKPKPPIMKKSEQYKEERKQWETKLTHVLQATGWPKGTTEQSRPIHAKLRELDDLIRYWEAREIQKYCNQHGYTDVYPFEVVRIVSDKCVEVRAMKVVQTKFPSDFTPGGFMGHYHDNRSGQDYEYHSDPEAPVQRVRWSEANRQWQMGKYIRFSMSDRPYKFYDYNF
jgi:hypothetical protein